jgi:hypothetical protein
MRKVLGAVLLSFTLLACAPATPTPQGFAAGNPTQHFWKSGRKSLGQYRFQRLPLSRNQVVWEDKTG